MEILQQFLHIEDNIKHVTQNNDIKPLSVGTEIFSTSVMQLELRIFDSPLFYRLDTKVNTDFAARFQLM
jgi:hypothetical protein